MPTLTREESVELLWAATKMSIEVAQDQVIDTLPHEIRWELVSFERMGKESTLNGIVAILYRDGRFPAIIDVTVKGVLDSSTIVRLIPSSHDFVNDIAATWNMPPGMGPFKPLGLMLPYPIGSALGRCLSTICRKQRRAGSGSDVYREWASKTAALDLAQESAC